MHRTEVTMRCMCAVHLNPENMAVLKHLFTRYFITCLKLAECYSEEVKLIRSARILGSSVFMKFTKLSRDILNRAKV